MSRSLCKALGIEWDGTESDLTELDTLFDNCVPYGGGGKGHKNGHYGHTHSDKAKGIMSVKKLGKATWNKNVKGYSVHNEDSKKRIGKKLSGSGNGRAILNESVVRAIIKLYLSKPILNDVGQIRGNGIQMSYIWAFSNLIASQYNISAAAIKRLLQQKSWKHVWNEYNLPD